MSDQWGGPGWWIGGDGKWHPPEESIKPRRRSNRWGAADASSIVSDGSQGLQHQLAPPRPLNEHRGPQDVRLQPTDEEPEVALAGDDEPELDASADDGESSVDIGADVELDSDDADVEVEDEADQVDSDADVEVEDKADEVEAEDDVEIEPPAVEVADDAVHRELAIDAADDVERADSSIGGWPTIDLRDEIETNRTLARQRVAWSSVSKAPVPDAAVTGSSPSSSTEPIMFDLRPDGDSVDTPMINSNDDEAGDAAVIDDIGTPAEPQIADSPVGVRNGILGLTYNPDPVFTPRSFDEEDEELPEVEGIPYAELIDDPFRRRTGPILLALATILAVLCGLLGALWLRERSTVSELRTDLAATTQPPIVDSDEDVLAEGDELDQLIENQIEDLREENAELEQQLADASALVLELPPGRVSAISAPFTPTFVDEQDGRLVAVDESGSYAVWGEGSDGPITETGELGGSPTGLFISRNRAWISTEATGIGVLTLANDAAPTFVDYGPARFLAEEERGYWTYNEERGQVARVDKSDGVVTNSISVPSIVVDMAIGAGSVWALGEDGLVYRINTADFTVQAFDLGEVIVSVTAGPDTLWALSAADGALRRVDPVSGEVLVTVPVGRDPIDAVVAGNSVWVGLRAGQSLIEVDTRTSAVVSRTSLADPPAALHEGDAGVFVTMEDSPLLLVSSPVSADDEG